MFYYFFFFKQKTAYEIRPCDWSSDVCSSDLSEGGATAATRRLPAARFNVKKTKGLWKPSWCSSNPKKLPPVIHTARDDLTRLTIISLAVYFLIVKHAERTIWIPSNRGH